jgi:hypothetical protein
MTDIITTREGGLTASNSQQQEGLILDGIRGTYK